MSLKQLASQLLEVKHGAKLTLKKPGLPPKLSGDKKFSPRTTTPYLDSQGRFCARGGLLDKPILDALIEIGASDEEIEKHVHPLGNLPQWKRWQKIKTER